MKQKKTNSKIFSKITINQQLTSLVDLYSINPIETVADIVSRKDISDKEVKRRNIEYINKVLERETIILRNPLKTRSRAR